MTEHAQDITGRIGGRVRQRRAELGWTVRELAKRAELSVRFLSDLEQGRANISVSRLEGLASALGTSVEALVRIPPRGPRQVLEALLVDGSDDEVGRALRVLEVVLGRHTPRVLALLGVRGAGKSTVGPGLADALGLPFVELDERIEARAGLSIGDLFTLHGERHYREIEAATLSELLASGEACVVALPGGVVDSDTATRLLRGGCTTIWLQGSAQTHWERVFAQGDTRPMSGRADPMADLVALLRRREPLYRQSDLVIDTSGLAPEAVVAALVQRLDAAGRRP